MPEQKCLFVTPIGSVDSPERKGMESISSVLSPICRQRKITFYTAIDIPNPGSITEQLLTSLREDALVVANLDGLNPNVMYEVGYRHALHKAMVVIAPKKTQLPFDIKDYRTIFYDDTILGLSLIHI